MTAKIKRGNPLQRITSQAMFLTDPFYDCGFQNLNCDRVPVSEANAHQQVLLCQA
ncbi:hypothetical protein NIES2104_61710 [Leptolyngbya sp. NIES-2104]|nr:hypothetical protein NIES2104_61710 [Leptolyngbya sp. NIES-2104]